MEQQEQDQEAAPDVEMTGAADDAAAADVPVAVEAAAVEEEKKEVNSSPADESNKGDSELSFDEKRLQNAMGYIKPLF